MPVTNGFILLVKPVSLALLRDKGYRTVKNFGAEKLWCIWWITAICQDIFANFYKLHSIAYGSQLPTAHEH